MSREGGWERLPPIRSFQRAKDDELDNFSGYAQLENKGVASCLGKVPGVNTSSILASPERGERTGSSF